MHMMPETKNYNTVIRKGFCKKVDNRTGQRVHHIMFIDSHFTFWVKGKSYLCRFVDTLNMGLIDELIVGKEVLTRWPEILQDYK